MTAVEWFIKDLKERGVEWIATLCGHGLDPLFSAAKRAGMRLVDTRNEQTAAYVAEATGRLTRRPGVVAVSSGVAHANAMTGVLTAHFDGTPLLLVSGAASLRTRGMGHFQDCDQVAMAAPVTRYARLIDQPERVLEILDEAWQAALTPGPVHLTFPMDMQQTEVAEKQLVKARPSAPPLTSADADLDSAAQLVAMSKSPLIVAGSGVYYAGEAKALADFCERFSIPVVVPIWDRGPIDHPLDEFLGVIGAATGGARLLPNADLVIMAGAAVDYRVGFLQPEALHSRARVLTLSRGWDRLAETYQRLSGKIHSQWLEESWQRHVEFRNRARARGQKQAREGLHAIHIVTAIREVLTDDTVLLIDGGSIGQWVHQLLYDRYPGHWLTCGRSGVIGWGIGGAMGARLTYPDRPVILLSGDGSFTFNVGDLECAVRQRLPFVAIVADDQAWGITKIGHEQQFSVPISSTLGPIEFAKLAKALGARGIHARTEPEIAEALREALSQTEVTVIHVPIVGGNP